MATTAAAFAQLKASGEAGAAVRTATGLTTIRALAQIEPLRALLVKTSAGTLGAVPRNGVVLGPLALLPCLS